MWRDISNLLDRFQLQAAEGYNAQTYPGLKTDFQALLNASVTSSSHVICRIPRSQSARLIFCKHGPIPQIIEIFFPHAQYSLNQLL